MDNKQNIYQLSDNAAAILKAAAFHYGKDDLEAVLQSILFTFYGLCPWWKGEEQVREEAAKWENGERRVKH